MKKYLGGTMGAYAACVAPLLFFGLPAALAIAALTSRIAPETIIIELMCVVGIVIGVIYLKRFFPQLYSWGEFDEKGVCVRSGFKKYTIVYAKCRDIGIGGYMQRGPSGAGIRAYYVFFSYDRFDEKYRANMNQWKPSNTQIKVGFSKKLYHYLLTVLPEHHAVVLKRDYEQIQQYKRNGTQRPKNRPGKKKKGRK